MGQPEQNYKPRYPTARTIAGISLIVPWVIVDIILKKQDPSLGYATGLFLGMITGYVLSPQPPRFWVMFLIAIVLAISHFLFVPHW
jgi:hypothetical protein